MKISRLFLGSLILVVFAASSFSQAETYTSTEGRFSIDMPEDKLKIDDTAIPGATAKDRTYGWQLVDELIGFSVGTFDLPSLNKGEEKARAERSADALTEKVTKSGGKLISRRDVAIGNYTGVEIKYTQNVQGFDITYINQYYVAGKRLYFLMGMWMTPEKEQRVIKAMNTFKILDPPAEPKEKSQ